MVCFNFINTFLFIGACIQIFSSFTSIFIVSNRKPQLEIKNSSSNDIIAMLKNEYMIHDNLEEKLHLQIDEDVFECETLSRKIDHMTEAQFDVTAPIVLYNCNPFFEQEVNSKTNILKKELQYEELEISSNRPITYYTNEHYEIQIIRKQKNNLSEAKLTNNTSQMLEELIKFYASVSYLKNNMAFFAEILYSNVMNFLDKNKIPLHENQLSYEDIKSQLVTAHKEDKEESIVLLLSIYEKNATINSSLDLKNCEAKITILNKI